jgi:hypothetical protein
MAVARVAEINRLNVDSTAHIQESPDLVLLKFLFDYSDRKLQT